VTTGTVERGSQVLLEARQLSAGYRKTPVVQDLDISVRAGEVVALLGANGAGKTTTLLALAGALPALEGKVYWKGQETSEPLHRRARAGLSLVPEQRSVFMRLSALDNLRLGRGSPARALELFPELEPHVRRRAGLLSGGQQQALTIARALASEPDLLMVDELSLGLAPMLVRRLLDAVRAAAEERGTAVLVVEQHIEQALRIADRAYVLQRGKLVLGGPASELRERMGEIERAYLPATGDAS
jgi:branched-chain amino acid transport system ATP-binding protein